MRRLLCLLSLATAFLVAGCAKQYVVLQPLDTALEAPATIGIGEIKDELPVDMEVEKKPKEEDMAKLRRFLGEEISKKEMPWTVVTAPGGNASYEVQGSFLEFKRGSGAARFFIGFGVGSAKATVGLKLVDKSTGATVFSGNFTGQVTSWAEGGEQTFRRIAKNFAKELEKQSKGLKTTS